MKFKMGFLFATLLCFIGFPVTAEIEITKEGQKLIDEFEAERPVVCLEGRDKHPKTFDANCPTTGFVHFNPEAMAAACSRSKFSDKPMCRAFLNKETYYKVGKATYVLSTMTMSFQTFAQWGFAKDGKSVKRGFGNNNVQAIAEINETNPVLVMIENMGKKVKEKERRNFEIGLGLNPDFGFKFEDLKRTFRPHLWFYLTPGGLDKKNVVLKLIMISENRGEVSAKELKPTGVFKLGHVFAFGFQLAREDWQRLQSVSTLRFIGFSGSKGKNELFRADFDNKGLVSGLENFIKVAKDPGELQKLIDANK